MTSLGALKTPPSRFPPWAPGPCFGILLALSGLVAAPAFAYPVVDALGTQVEIPKPPARIVTLAPSLGELAADIAGEHLERIVGVSEYTDYPPALSAHAASVGPYHHVNLEFIAALKPDLILATRDGNVKDQIDHLRELGLPVVVVATDDFGAVAQSMRLVARAMGDGASGEKMATEFLAGLARIRGEAKKTAAPHRVLLQLGDEPLVVVGRKGFLNEALVAVGAENVYGDVESAYPRPALEDAVARAPDTILVLALGGDIGVFRKMADGWTKFSAIPAVKLKRVQVLRADALLRPSMRLLEGLSLLRKAIDGGA